MAIWAIADLHLSFGTPNKKMDIFGENWRDHPDKIAKHWQANISDEDLVLLPGDISWAQTAEQVTPDLQWIESLPGTKVMLRGNHDYWWTSLKKVSQILPPSIHVVQNNSFCWGDYCIGGSRLWDTDAYNFDRYSREIPMAQRPVLPAIFEEPGNSAQDVKIFERELGRLEISLRSMPPTKARRIVMTHYPPIGVPLHDSQVSKLLEQYDTDICVFGHLHNMSHDFDPLFGSKNGVSYHLVAADYLNFEPLLIAK
jgi:predicted phosphohydrolase